MRRKREILFEEVLREKDRQVEDSLVNSVQLAEQEKFKEAFEDWLGSLIGQEFFKTSARLKRECLARILTESTSDESVSFLRGYLRALEDLEELLCEKAGVKNAKSLFSFLG